MDVYFGSKKLSILSPKRSERWGDLPAEASAQAGGGTPRFMLRRSGSR